MLRTTFLFLATFAGGTLAQEPTGWQVQESRSANGSVTEITLLLRSESGIRSRGALVRPILIIRCVEGRTELGVFTGPYQPSGHETHTVRFRLDRGRATLNEWYESQGHRAVFHPNPMLLLPDLAITKLLLFEFETYDGSRVIARFATEGLDEHLPRVAEACGWGDELPGGG
jgi:hypothetical protein